MTMLEKICLRSEEKRGTTRPEYFAAIKAQRIKERTYKNLCLFGNILCILCGIALLWVVASYISWLCGIGGPWNFFDQLLYFCRAYGGV